MAGFQGQKVALVTGASSGIGEATARQLLEDGYTVYAAARRVEKMQGLKDAGARLLALDVTEDRQMVDAMEQIIGECGRIDVLINNAGYGSYGALEDVPLSEARHQFEVNVFGLARLTQLALPHMRRQRSGKIINVSSVGGKFYEPLGSWYHATKFAVEGLSDCLRVEVKEFGIDVIVIQPGGIRTEWGEISAANLLKTSGDTAYAEHARRHAQMLRSANAGNMLSPPEVIARAISGAVRSRRPHPRYAAGFMAKPMLFIRKWASDRMFDGVVRMVMRQGAR